MSELTSASPYAHTPTLFALSCMVSVGVDPPYSLSSHSGARKAFHAGVHLLLKQTPGPCLPPHRCRVSTLPPNPPPPPSFPPYPTPFRYSAQYPYWDLVNMLRKLILIIVSTFMV